MFCSWKPAPEGFTLCLLLLLLKGKVHASDKGPDDVRVVVTEGRDAILPCSLSTKENIESKLFHWKKDGQEVFTYDAGVHYNNNPSDTQDPQFRGRVFHFQDELKHGNASIIIKDTKVADSGDYTCVFPHLQPEPQTFHIKLVVGAAPKPNIKILNATEDWSLLQCDVQGAFPEPKVEWKDSAGDILPAEEPKVTYRGGRYDVTLLATVNKTDHFHCVVSQGETGHQTEAETFVPFCGKMCEASTSQVIIGWSVGLLVGLLVGLVLGVLILAAAQFVLKTKKTTSNKGNKEGCRRRQQKNSSYKAPVDSHELENGSGNKPPGVSLEASENGELTSSV